MDFDPLELTYLPRKSAEQIFIAGAASAYRI